MTKEKKTIFDVYTKAYSVKKYFLCQPQYSFSAQNDYISENAEIFLLSSVLRFC